MEYKRPTVKQSAKSAHKSPPVLRDIPPGVWFKFSIDSIDEIRCRTWNGYVDPIDGRTWLVGPNDSVLNAAVKVFDVEVVIKGAQ